MDDGLLDPVIVSFVFTPLVVTMAMLFAQWWKRMPNSREAIDAPGWLLATAVRALPEARRDWGAAMLAELTQVNRRMTRWRFALGCVRVALFPPQSETLLQTAGRSPICGLISVTLPPLGLPLIYVAAALLEAIGGNPLTASRGSYPETMMVVVKLIVLLTVGCLLAGMPLGLAGWWRRERLRWLSAAGMILSVSIFGYFLIGIYLLAGGE
jgi:hypothetical protein